MYVTRDKLAKIMGRAIIEDRELRRGLHDRHPDFRTEIIDTTLDALDSAAEAQKTSEFWDRYYNEQNFGF